MADSPGRILVPYSEAAPRVGDADLLLYRNGSAASWLVRLWTLSPYSHVATAYCEPDGRLCIVDTMEGTGGRGGPEKPVSLLSEVQANPGKIDVYAVDTARFPEYDRAKAVRWALENLPGRPYGRITIWHMLRCRLPFLRLRYKPDFNDRAVTGGNYVCSTARAEMDCFAGKDPVPNLANAFVTPAHYANSLLFKYLFTLVPDGQEEKP